MKMNDGDAIQENDSSYPHMSILIVHFSAQIRVLSMQSSSEKQWTQARLSDFISHLCLQLSGWRQINKVTPERQDKNYQNRHATVGL